MSEMGLCRPALVRERPCSSPSMLSENYLDSRLQRALEKIPKLPLGMREMAVTLCRPQSSYTVHSNQDTHKTTLVAGGLPWSLKAI